MINFYAEHFCPLYQSAIDLLSEMLLWLGVMGEAGMKIFTTRAELK